MSDLFANLHRQAAKRERRLLDQAMALLHAGIAKTLPHAGRIAVELIDTGEAFDETLMALAKANRYPMPRRAKTVTLEI